MTQIFSKKDVEILTNFDAENTGIVQDFNLLLNYLIENKIPLTANDVLSPVVFKEINAFLTHKIEYNKPKVFAKSYPNVLALFLLLRLSGLTKIEAKKTKKFLTIEPKTYEQWNTLNKTEQYFHILKPFITNFSLEPLNEQKSDFHILIIKDLASKKIVNIQKTDYLYSYFVGKIILSALELFGFIGISGRLNNDGNWEFVNITVNKSILLAYHYFENISFIFSDIEDKNILFETDIKRLFPKYVNNLNVEKETVSNANFIFQVSLKYNNVKLKISISSDADLDSLCQFILDSLDFDYDHLYTVEMKSNSGAKICYNGAPTIDYAEPPTTEDITIGELPISVGSTMIYTYDFGANWTFNIQLLEIEHGVRKMKKTKLLDISGDIPEQYDYE